MNNERHSSTIFSINILKIILLACVIFPGLVRAAGQNDDILRKTVELSVRNQSIKDILAVINAQTGAVFSYDPQLFNDSRKISLQTTAPIAAVLSQLLPANIIFKATGLYIILLPAPQQPEARPVTTEPSPQITVQRDTSLNLKKIPPMRSSGRINYTCHNSIILKNDIIMKQQKNTFYGLFLAFLSSITSLTAQSATTDSTANRPENIQPFQLTFVYPLGIYGANTAQNTYNLSLNIIGGRTGGIYGAEFAWLYNMNEYNVQGAQFAGIFNLTKGNVKGAQFAGVFNTAEGHVHGSQFAGVYNMATKGMQGAQYSGVFNISSETSVQIAGTFNIAEKAHTQIAGVVNVADSSDVQIAGVANVADSNNVQIGGVVNVADNSNVQIAGVANVADNSNVQIAGVANIADSSDVQIGGVVNITKRGGFQLGVINIRDTTDGYMLGVVNIAKKGGLLEVELAAGDFGFLPVTVSFRSGREKLYSIIALGCNFNDNYWASGFGLGTSFRFSNNWGLNLEAVHYTLTDDHFNMKKFNIVEQIRPVFYWKIAKHFKLFAGPTFNLYAGDNTAENPIDFYIPYSHRVGEEPNTNSTKFATWIGFTAGVRF